MSTIRLTAMFAAAALAVVACSSTTTDEDLGAGDDELRASSACTGKACGERCSLCAGRPSCFETAVPKFCSADKKCRAEQPVCGAADAGGAYNPCAGKTCGQSCKICPPGDPDCFETAVLKACNPQGQCVPDTGVSCNAQDAGAYSPCGGKACGDTCKVCPPGDPDCFETAVLKYCQADGACSPTAPTCN